MVPESPLEQTEHGLVPTGKGWFVLNARDVPWVAREGRGAFSEFEGFEGAADFSQLGINITDPQQAYARFPRGEPTRYEEGLLPGG
jgi:hypothetical protein